MGDTERIAILIRPLGPARAIVETGWEGMVAELACPVSKLDTDDAQPRGSQLISPSHEQRILGGVHDHAPTVEVQDARQWALSLLGLVDVETNLVALDALNDLTAMSDATDGGKAADHLGKSGRKLSLHSANILEDLFVGRIGSHGRFGDGGVCVSRPFDQPGVEARIGREGEVRVSELARKLGRRCGHIVPPRHRARRHSTSDEVLPRVPGEELIDL